MKNICFDLETVILNKNKIPNESIIDMVQKLKHQGYIIYIQSLEPADSYLTISTLLRMYKIPFDKIYFNKPQADIYIDSKAVNISIKELEMIINNH